MDDFQATPCLTYELYCVIFRISLVAALRAMQRMRQECPACLPENRKVLDIIKAQEQSKDLHEQFHRQVRTEPSYESFLNPMLTGGRGVLEIFCERPGKLTKGAPFHQDNAPAQKSVVAMAAVCDCGLEQVDHPPYYSLDLAPSDNFLFPNIKKNHCPGETGLPSSVFQAVHEMCLVLLFKVLNYSSSVGLSGRKQCSWYRGRLN